MEYTDKERRGIPRFTVLKILMAHFGCLCKYKPKGEKVWERGLVNAKVLANFETHDVVLLLKPLYAITTNHVQKIHELMHEEGEDYIDELDLSEEGIKQFREHLQDNPKLAPYIAVDYLRREGYHFEMYGINLFMANIAHVFNPK